MRRPYPQQVQFTWLTISFLRKKNLQFPNQGNYKMMFYIDILMFFKGECNKLEKKIIFLKFTGWLKKKVSAFESFLSLIG